MINFINNNNYKTIYSIALFAILIMVSISILNMVYMISFHSQYAELINKSGKQRMLSQRITLFIIHNEKNQFNRLKNELTEFEKNHNFLKNKNISEEISKIYTSTPHNLNQNLETFLKLVKNNIENRKQEEIDTIFKLQDKILISLDEIVKLTEKKSKEFSNFMVIIEIIIFILIALLLLWESKFIFRPVLQKMEDERNRDKRFQEKLKIEVDKKTEKLEHSLEIINHYVFTSKTDKNGIITYVSNAFCELSGYSKDELIGKTHRIIKHPDNPSEAFSMLWKTITKGETYKGEVKNKRKNGEDFWLSSLITPEFDKNGDIIGYIAYRKDITHEKSLEKINEKLELMVEDKTKELQQYNEELKRLSETDSLTGIFNRKKLKDSLNVEINKANRYNEVFSLILLDIDFFKKVNDNHGHLTGDNVLIEVCKIISKNIRDIDLFARWGGEEFVILVYKQDINQAEFIAEKLRTQIEKANIENLKITCSFGVTQYERTNTSEILFKKADDALYEAKETGRNKVCSK